MRAWHKLAGEGLGPSSIRPLKEEGRKSAVYRLAGVGPGGAAVVAKRCLSERGAIEWKLYTEVLPRLPISGLHCHGSVADEDSRFRWIFLEDAGDEAPALGSERHRALALGWLGSMHTSAQLVAAAAWLPDRSAASYLELLRQARHMTRVALEHPSLEPDGVSTLKAIITDCNGLESYWDEIDRLCERMPRTLVHGDFAEKNLRVRLLGAQETLHVMDWEKAGWGIPGADLAECVAYQLNADVTAYWSVVRDCWPQFEWADVCQLAQLGTLFRSIDALVWMNRAFVKWAGSRSAGDSARWYGEEARWCEARLSSWIKTAAG